MSTRTETEVGISEYISAHKGFRGIIKARYQDFIVNEINSEGEIVHFDRTTLQESDSETTKNETTFVNVLSEDDKSKLSALLSAPNDEYVILNAGKDKQSRTDVHRSVREVFPELESKTQTDEDGNVTIKVLKSTGSNGRRAQNNTRKKYCKFVMYKENIDTMTAINRIGKKLRVKNLKGFQFAGTKDKRGITVQEVTAPLSFDRLKGMAKLDSNICLGNFSYCDKPLHLGDLTGNHFTIIIRNINGTKSQISTGVDSFKTIGFINYYGMQRFGTTCVPTQNIGIEILKNNWEKVHDLILNIDSAPDDLKAALKTYYENGEAKDALELIRYKNGIEACFLRGIEKFGKTQLIQAFALIPRNIRLIYLHSYQSFIWNKVVSLRISKYGIKPIMGDLVFKDVYDENTKNESEPAEKRQKKNEYRSTKRSIREVFALKNEDLDRFGITDVVMPLPGHSIVYPLYNGFNIYEDVMKVDGIDTKTGMVHKVEEYSMPGAYRSIVVKPQHLSHEELSYNSCKENLALSDKDIMKKISILNNKENGKFRALKIEFSLPTSSYATVALREVLKSDLSSTAQQQLTDEHVRQCKEEEEKINL